MLRRLRVSPHRTLAAAMLAASCLVLSFSLVAQAAMATSASSRTSKSNSEVAPAAGLGISRIVGGLTQPVFLTNAGDARLFVVERPGRIRILKKVNGSWKIAQTFLDIRSKVKDTDDEQGLLGLAFPPDYATSGRFYVYYVNNSGNEVLSEFKRLKKNFADPHSERKLLTISDPYVNHNGGWLSFKPSDPGNLYISTGDGGSAGDPGNRAQNVNVLLGKILRINPKDPDGSGPKHYSIPADNPFVGTNGRDEVYAYGLRNPWRDSFDALTGDLWIGDVGQDRYEEVDHVTSGSGKNFGWHLLEGFHLYPSGGTCSSNCKTLPVAEYSHAASGEDNCAVTGGYVARRSGATLYGQYIFGDYCSGRIWHVSTSFNGGALPAPLNTSLAISSFGVGRDLTVYAVDLRGAIYRITGS